jgi:hypothetical protein
MTSNRAGRIALLGFFVRVPLPSSRFSGLACFSGSARITRLSHEHGMVASFCQPAQLPHSAKTAAVS